MKPDGIDLKELISKEITSFIACDPLHLLKRARYRFLKKVISLDLELKDYLVDLDEIEFILNYKD